MGRRDLREERPQRQRAGGAGMLGPWSGHGQRQVWREGMSGGRGGGSGGWWEGAGAVLVEGGGRGRAPGDRDQGVSRRSQARRAGMYCESCAVTSACGL